MSDRIERLSKRLEYQGGRTVAFFQGVQDADWERTVYSEGANWKVHEVLKHFLSSEKGIARLVKLVVEGEPGVPENFDLDLYNERKVDQLEGITPQDLLVRFADARAQTVQMVNRFTYTDLDKVGRHPFLGESSVESMLQLMYRHNQIHQRDLRRLLSRSPV